MKRLYGFLFISLIYSSVAAARLPIFECIGVRYPKDFDPENRIVWGSVEQQEIRIYFAPDKGYEAEIKTDNINVKFGSDQVSLSELDTDQKNMLFLVFGRKTGWFNFDVNRVTRVSRFRLSHGEAEFGLYLFYDDKGKILGKMANNGTAAGMCLN